MPKNSKVNLAFAFNNLSPSQATYLCFKELNRSVANNASFKPIVFFEEYSAPCIPVMAPIIHMRDASMYQGNIICTDIASLISTKLATGSKRIYYIFDLEWLRNTKYNREDYDILLKDPNIIKFTRSKDHLKELKTRTHAGLSDVVVPNFEMNIISEILNGS